LSVQCLYVCTNITVVVIIVLVVVVAAW